MTTTGSGKRAADLVAGLLVAAVAGGALLAGLRMPMGGTFGGVDNPWYASPGALPILVGALLVVLGTGLVFGAVRRPPSSQTAESRPPPWPARARAIFMGPRARRGAFAWGWIVAYVALLDQRPFTALAGAFAALGAGRLLPTRFLETGRGANFLVASALFLSIFVYLYYRPDGRRPRGWRAVAILVGSVFTPLLVGYLVTEALRFPLP